MKSVEYFLLNELDLRLSKRQYAQELILNHSYDVSKLIALIHRADERQKVCILCFCDTFSRAFPAYFSEQLQSFVDWANNETHETNKRSLTNIFLTFLKNKQYSFTAKQEELITEVCFSWLIDDSLVATKSNCISCLTLLAKKYAWINEELIPIIEQMYPNMPVSFQSRARKILK